MRRLLAARRLLIGVVVPFLLLSHCCCEDVRLLFEPAAARAASAEARGDACCPATHAGHSSVIGPHHSTGPECAGESEDGAGHHSDSPCSAAHGCPCTTLGRGVTTLNPSLTLSAPVVTAEVLAAPPVPPLEPEAVAPRRWCYTTDLPPPYCATGPAPDAGRAPPSFS